MSKKWFLLLGVVFLLLLIRLVLFYLFQPLLQENQPILLTTTLLSDPTRQGNFQKFAVRYTTNFSSAPIQIYLPNTHAFHYGQNLILTGKITHRKLKNGKAIVAMYYPNVVSVEKQNGFILALAYLFRQKLSESYHSLLPQTFASLLLGVVLGVKETMTKSFQTNLQSVGVVHVIAASGMNVTMVAAFLQSMLSKFLGRKLVLVITIVLIIFYALVSGVQASILRASIMTILVFSAQLIGRQYTALYSLFLTAIIMLFIQPELVGDVGFQLSLFSTLGILVIKPLIPNTSFVNDDIGTTIAAQLATVPILLITFGQYGLLSIFVNGFVLWTIPLLMVLGGVGGLLALLPFISILGKVLIILCWPLLFFFITVVNFFGSLQWNISIQSVSLITLFGYYFVLISLVVFIKINQKKRALLVNSSSEKNILK